MQKGIIMCNLCPLLGYVPAEYRDSKLLIVGQNPGRKELEAGRPFMGPCSWIFDYLNRDKYSITNAVQCCGDVRRCHYCPKLHEDIAIIKPKIIITFGVEAHKRLAGCRPAFGVMKGNIYSCYHPSGENNKYRAQLIEQLAFVKSLEAL